MHIAFLQFSPRLPCNRQTSQIRSFVTRRATLTRRPRTSVSVPSRVSRSPVANAEREKNSGNSPKLLFDGFVRRLLLGYDLTPELGAILSAYFVQGALGISRLAISFFLKDELNLSPAACSALMGIAIFPWLIKPLYGFLTDALPIFGYRRRPYLVGAALLGTVSWFSLSVAVNSAPTALAAVVGTSASVAIADVVVDSLVVARVRGLSASRSGALQSLCWGISAIGGLLSAYLSGSLLEALGTRKIFGLTSALPLITAVLGMLISEPRVDVPLKSFGRVVVKRSGSLFSALRNPTVLLPSAFIFLWQAMPNADSALFFFQTNVLHFGPEFLGRVRLASSAAALAGLWIYNTTLRELPLKTILLYATLVSVPLGLSQVLLVTRANVALGISDQLFALTDSAVLAAFGQVAFMPTLVLAARLCPPGVEGTLFAALMSLYNASGATSNELGAFLTASLGVTETNFDNLALLVVICNLSSLLPLPLLNFVDRAPQDVPEQQHASDSLNLKEDNSEKQIIDPVQTGSSDQKG